MLTSGTMHCYIAPINHNALECPKNLTSNSELLLLQEQAEAGDETKTELEAGHLDVLLAHTSRLIGHSNVKFNFGLH